MVNYKLRKRDEFLDVITLWPSGVYAGIFASSRRDSHGTPVGISLGMPVSKFLPYIGISAGIPARIKTSKQN